MSSLSCFVQIVFCSSGYYILLMSQIVFQHFFEIHNLRFIVDKSQHDHTECILQLCMLIQLIQNDIGIGIFSQINTDTHAFTAGMIVQSGNTVNLFIPDKLCNLFDQPCLIYHVRKFRNNDLALSVRQSLNIGYGTNSYFATACSVRFFYTSSSEDRCTCREIGTLYDIQNFLYFCISVFFNAVIDNFYHSINNLTKIVRRNIGSHTYSNTGGTVYQKIGITGRQYRRLFFCFIKVWLEIYGIFIDIRQHFHGNFT